LTVTTQLFPDVDAHVIDTNLFVAFERNDAIDLLERNVSEHEVTVSVPRRVYEELTPESLPYDTPPVDEAIEAGWVELLDEVDYANPVVSATMDMVRRYIAAADERAAHTVEQADAEVGGATATLLERGTANSVAVYTNDLPAFRASTCKASTTALAS
jgi:predicted nucleic acid-binding protein